MQLTAFTDYSLRALIYLAVSDGRQVSSREIAESYGISVHHVAKVCKWLVNEGYATATRGKGGGLRLAIAPEKIKIGEVVRRAERGTGLVECMRGRDGSCAIESACGLIAVLNDAHRAFFETLDRYSLADATANKRGIAKLLRQPELES
ncbi:Rrf2 family transcriptional regulator [Denitrobaculum tricleocarpae]|uniref:Rrf2 family transcriptional regulator n=1 Tax=Denitrobaculum tricleocarpae TaxID=2591009 RepID=A0A545TKS6_9PROT|nr:Rrf2 family transcriptional regulator [Denitrobaculum tricleocarpae]TQV77825.1 Rrf2 family transcriptional regulator [Denitrobaculum tricleocarpae]